jgi:hypothetical protein
MTDMNEPKLTYDDLALFADWRGMFETCLQTPHHDPARNLTWATDRVALVWVRGRPEWTPEAPRGATDEDRLIEAVAESILSSERILQNAETHELPELPPVRYAVSDEKVTLAERKVVYFEDCDVPVDHARLARLRRCLPKCRYAGGPMETREFDWHAAQWPPGRRPLVLRFPGGGALLMQMVGDRYQDYPEIARIRDGWIAETENKH